MAKIFVYADPGYVDTSTPADNVTIPVRIILGPPQNFRGGLTINVNAQTNGESQIQEIIRDAVVASVNSEFGTAFVAQDVRIVDGSPIGYVVNFPVSFLTLAVADDIGVFVNSTGRTLRLTRIWAAARVLTSGTATVVAKNGSGTTLASVDLVSPGPVAAGVTPSPNTLAPGDRIRFGISALGTGLLDATAGVWYISPGAE